MGLEDLFKGFENSNKSREASFCLKKTCEGALESPDAVVSDYYSLQVCAHTRHIICTHQAHYMHTSGTQKAQPFDTVFEKMSYVPFVCHMCAHTWSVSRMLQNEKYGQFPFE